jgi:hypothetical protein
MTKIPLIYIYIGNRTTIAISASFDTLSLIHKISNNAHFASISSSLLGGADYVEADSIRKPYKPFNCLWFGNGGLESDYARVHTTL